MNNAIYASKCKLSKKRMMMIRQYELDDTRKKVARFQFSPKDKKRTIEVACAIGTMRLRSTALYGDFLVC